MLCCENMLESHAHGWLNSITDIVNNIQIESQFYIYHPQYRLFALPRNVIQRFQQIPERLQHKYLSLTLRKFIYGIYFNGSLISSLRLDTDTATSPVYHNLEPKVHTGINEDFYAQLQANNSGTGYFDSGWQVVSEEPDGSLALSKGGLTLHIERETDEIRPSSPGIQVVDRYTRVGDFVAVYMPNHLLQNEFYIAVGNAGKDRQEYIESHLTTVRIYFNFNSDCAARLMHDITRSLNAAQIPFTFKVLYNPVDYDRYDAGILLFQRNYYPAIKQILEVIYTQNQSDFSSEIPLFTKFLSVGLALAEEPVTNNFIRETFGLHRCQILADALLQAWLQHKNSPGERISLIEQTFADLDLNLQIPYLNADSEDVYHPLFV